MEPLTFKRKHLDATSEGEHPNQQPTQLSASPKQFLQKTH